MSIDVTRPERPLSELVAEEIRAMLGRRRVSGRELARRLNVSSSWVNYRLTGAQPIDVNDLQRIAVALDVTVLDLLPRDVRSQATVTQPEQDFREVTRTRPPGHPAGSTRPPTARRPQRRTSQPVPLYGTASQAHPNSWSESSDR